jgi:5-methylthioadenosine/S-adenosylhomocysteine deaminase
METWAGHERITATVVPHSPYLLFKEYLIQSAALAREFHAPIHIHASETQAEVDTVKNLTGGLTPFEYLDSIRFLGTDVIAAHAVVLSDNDIDIILRTGTGVAHNPESNMKLGCGVMPLCPGYLRSA